MTTWFEGYKGKLIGFVVETRKGMFLPIIGRCIESNGDDDCMIAADFTHARVETLDEALVALDAEADKLVRVFRKPASAGGLMGNWLWPLVKAEDGVDPRKVQA